MIKIRKRPPISAIVAMAENRVIGKDNQLPWHMPADLKHFKALTIGHPVLMGRKTYEAIRKPLPERTNIILTHDLTFNAPGCFVIHSIEEALKLASLENKKTIFVIGGSDLYRQLLPYTKRIYQTIVHHHFDGDAYFPTLDKNEWREVERKTYAADKNNPYGYSFITLERV